MRKSILICFLGFLGFFLIQCKSEKKVDTTVEEKVLDTDMLTEVPDDVETPQGMVWIPGGTFMQGATEGDAIAMIHEKPAHEVAVRGFFIDTTEVTNAQFQEFVEATDYVTIAERKIDWEEIKKQVLPGTPKPADSIMQPGSLVFTIPKIKNVDLSNYTQWWSWTIGANWRHPFGPKSSIEGKDNHPVVHIAYDDAVAYAKWSGRRLPTEAEWEYAARGQGKSTIYNWGNDAEILEKKANTWTGQFPVENSIKDGHDRTAPVGSFPPNSNGLYDMAGNVWEWTQDWYHINYYNQLKQSGVADNPKGASKPYNPNAPTTPEKVIRGGSFLCNASYCASYRNSARMASSTDSSMDHLGFRTVVDLKMLQKSKN